MALNIKQPEPGLSVPVSLGIAWRRPVTDHKNRCKKSSIVKLNCVISHIYRNIYFLLFIDQNLI
jgi:hypothetical protein